MAEESEMKMEALKKAYAEIILNTSKEAAARVMVAERKARCFEQQLDSLKQESLSMLLRLKDHFNSTIIETESRSVKQQMKIEELEAQLGEAEGIIVDLRDEFKQVQEQLEIMRHNQKKLRRDEPAEECVPEDNAPDSSVMFRVSDTKSVLVDYEKKVASLHPTALDDKQCHNVNSSNLSVKTHLNQFDAPNDDFSSIIIQNSQTDLCRNGCTQRIRAFEGNLSKVRLPTSQSEDQKFLNLSITNAEKIVNRRQYTNDSASSCQKLLCSNDESNAKNISSGDLMYRTSCYKDQAIRSRRRSARKSSRYREAIASLQGSRRSSGRTRLRPFLGPLEACSSNLNLQAVDIPIEIVEMDPKKIKVCRVSESNDLSCNNKNAICAEERTGAETTETLGDKSNTISGSGLLSSVLIDVPISEGFGSSHCQLAGDDKLLKFTFHRKRRKNVLGKIDENIFQDRGPIRRRLENSTNVSMVKNGICKDETQGETEKMKQVAHQLVSLTGTWC
ncbi:hypothetical protein BVRB_2g040830 isoform A [Beta vulgaris subsp. vulgaris]|uniref:uncharacterized protein LOC104887436 isoform X1 n=2 Tax=Beta vulgaris subsp. vulgaris TaxID=3555 RepID=UPI00053F5B47|nr:uncharacterized protein LOC104887436 isoform X1 [Beta vulgaris subsp. vulgaris]KMT17173.1 hypothetical protein BVRB_2g040830 isoform A [Beta vulgaris subsp. vulgaris]